MILVTGATGFVGAAVARRTAAEGAALRVLTRPSGDRRNLEGLDAEICEGDLLDPASLAKAVRGCEAVFHVAADYRLWTRDPGAMMRANIDGTVALMRAAMDAGVHRVVYTSSVATLGINADRTPANEETPVSIVDMIGPYKRSKFRAEEAVRRMIAEDGLSAVIVNPSTPMGPRDIKPTPTGRMLVEAASGKMPAYVDTGLNVVHVDDVADGHWRAYKQGEIGERYILGGTDMPLRDILAIVARQTRRRAPRFRLPHDLIMPVAWAAEGWAILIGRGEPFVTIDGLRMAKKHMYFSSAKAEAALGYTFRSAEDAVADALAWFRENGYFANP